LKFRIAVALVVLAVVALAAPAVSRASFSATFRHALAARMNTYRRAHGRGALTLNLYLERSACAHSTDMARHRMLSHSASTGASWEQRIRYWRYRGTYIGENLVVGALTPRGVMRAWRASSVHRANLLGAHFRAIGIGIVRGSWGGRTAVYVTADFGGS
jgi:uncharacterized protein YkwD